MRCSAILPAVLCLILPAVRTRAELVNIELTGEVTFVDESPILQGLFHIGDPVTGVYTYNTEMGDHNPWGSVGDYRFRTEPYGVILDISGLTIQTDPENVDFIIGILNNMNGRDSYGVSSEVNLPLPNGSTVWHISWQLDDWSATALSSDRLPTDAPVLEDWQRVGSLNIEFGFKGGSGIGVGIESATVVPEPSTFCILAVLSMLSIGRRRARRHEG